MSYLTFRLNAEYGAVLLEVTDLITGKEYSGVLDCHNNLVGCYNPGAPDNVKESARAREVLEEALRS